MEITIHTQINGQEAFISLKTAPLTEKDCVKTGPVRGYVCETVTVNGKAIPSPEHVTLYADTFKKQGPEVCFKFDAGKMLAQQFGLKAERMYFVPVPDEEKETYINGLKALDRELAAYRKQMYLEREQNDRDIQPDAVIEMSMSPRFIGVRYPKPSNREKDEAREWCRCFDDERLEDWVELALDPYCEGLGCGSQKKYRLSYENYSNLLAEFQSVCQSAGIIKKN